MAEIISLVPPELRDLAAAGGVAPRHGAEGWNKGIGVLRF